jgi:hypothetical protein
VAVVVVYKGGETRNPEMGNMGKYAVGTMLWECLQDACKHCSLLSVKYYFYSQYFKVLPGHTSPPGAAAPAPPAGRGLLLLANRPAAQRPSAALCPLQ